jgi:antitoxin CptB
VSDLDRIRWHCRRGLLELDLILDRFNRQHLATLDAARLEEFKELLALDDNELLDLIMGRIPVADQRLAPVLSMLQAA